MIKVYWRPRGKVIEGEIDALKSQNMVWADCANPSRDEIDQISKLTGIDATEFMEHLLDYERPITMESEDYSLIVFGAPVPKNGGVEITSLAVFILNEQNIVTIHTHEIEGLDRFRRDILQKNPKFFDSPTKTVERLLGRIVDMYFTHLDKLQEEAERIETAVFRKPQKKLMQEIFQIRKSTLVFHKALIANREVILSMEKQYITRLSKKDLSEFRDLYNDLVQLVDTTDTLRSILSGVLDMYSSSMSNQINQTIKKLTVVASYVFIPTLIASIYGMNFAHMPEISWIFGYPFALFLMLASTVLVWLYFKRTNML